MDHPEKWKEVSHSAIAGILQDILSKEHIGQVLDAFELDALSEAEGRIREMGYVCPDGTPAPVEEYDS